MRSIFTAATVGMLGACASPETRPPATRPPVVSIPADEEPPSFMAPHVSDEGTSPASYTYAEDRGQVIPEMMVASVRAQSKMFTACMVGHRGSAKFAITVAADGSVLRVTPSGSDIPEPQMKCLIAAWFRAVFPPPVGSARAYAVIPLVFK